MNDLHKNMLIVLCLLGFTAMVFFLKYGEEKTQASILKEEKQASEVLLSDIDARAKLAIERASLAEKQSQAEKKRAVESLEKAHTAAKMLEKMKLENALTQNEIIANLNAQLEREADARIAAETASIELAKQRDALKSSAEETLKTLEALRKAKNLVSDAEIDRVRKLLEAKDAEIARLKKSQEELEALRNLAEKLQTETEKRIIDAGGEVTIPRHKRLLSPNLRMN